MFNTRISNYIEPEYWAGAIENTLLLSNVARIFIVFITLYFLLFILYK